MLSHFGSTPVLLLAGPNQAAFYVHKRILSTNSSYWRGRISEGDYDSCPGQPHFIGFCLPKEEPTIVALFLEFIYSTSPGYKVTSLDISSFSGKEIFVHAELYLFGATYGVPHLQDYAVSEVHKLLTTYHTARGRERLNLRYRRELIQKAYSITSTSNDELRKLLARDFARRWELYRSSAWRDGELDEESDLGELFKAVPRFERDLIQYLGNGTMTSLPSPEKITQASN